MKILKIIGKVTLALLSATVVAISAFLAINADFSNPDSLQTFLDNKKKVWT